MYCVMDVDFNGHTRGRMSSEVEPQPVADERSPLNVEGGVRSRPFAWLRFFIVDEPKDEMFMRNLSRIARRSTSKNPTCFSCSGETVMICNTPSL